MSRSTPRAADFTLLDTIRVRTHRLLKAHIAVVKKFTEEDDDLNAFIVLKDELLVRLAAYERAFEEHEASLIGSGDIAECRTITEEFMAVNSAALKAKVHISHLIAGLCDTHTPAQPTVAAPTTMSSHPYFKVAPMRISPFSGDLTDWIEFKATCEAVLLDTMPEIQRLQHLKDALSGEPRLLVNHVLPGECAYDNAMKLLTERYENTRAIVNGHLKKLYAIKSAEFPSSKFLGEIQLTLTGLIAALKCCKINTDTWDSILMFHLTQRFDNSTLEAWEEKLNGTRSIPKLSVFLEFLQTRITILNTTESFTSANQSIEKPLKSNSKQVSNQKHPFDFKKNHDKPRAFFTLKATYECVLCKGIPDSSHRNHLPSRCTKFPRLPVNDRQALITRNKLCLNCFYPHEVTSCPFEPACTKCSNAHHTLLHKDGKQTFLTLAELSNDAQISDTDDDQRSPEIEASDTLSMMSGYHFYHINDEIEEDTLLATAIVPIRSNNRSALLKTLIDQGATSNLITIRGCDLIRMRFRRCKTSMLGVGSTPVGNVLGRVVFEIGSTHDENYKLTITAIVVQSIGDVRGFNKDLIRKWQHLKGLPLADPAYFESSRIDMLLGGSAHADFIMEGLIKGERNQPIAQNSSLGWIISGNTALSNKGPNVCRHTKIESVDEPSNDLNQLLRSFWELEEATASRILTDEERIAEEVFAKSVQRADDGKFVVDLPFKLNPFEQLGESFSMAKRRYMSLQRRFEKNPNLKQQYDAVLEEYLELNHMELVTDEPPVKCFLPHHAVLKESSSTTKVRTVFDASAKTSSGISLNECLCVGPVIQSDLFDLIMSWRKFEFALSSDIEKMYRMMYVNPAHANLQLILWHRPGTQNIAVYRLRTITFGTSSAPFEATRGIYEIGKRIREIDPQLADIIQKCFYVDDFLKSFPSIESAVHTRNDITKTLAAYGFNLRKWKSNDARTLVGVSESDRESCIDFDSTFKTLGIAWQASSDEFVFKSLQLPEDTLWTKRKVLSAIAKMFDPLGWLAPFVVRAKMLMQNIWRVSSDIDWDSELPNHITRQWEPIFKELITPLPITVPRWIKLGNQNKAMEIHAFCDASNFAYACCIYMRIVHADGSISCNLLTAKTKVAPVRVTTIPRLELCGAQLLAKLTLRCIQALEINDVNLVAWCDSKIVLAWLATHPSKWVTFVANRVSEIQQSINTNHWRHIRTKQNPADIASRGCTVNDLKDSAMWWNGPSFLSNPSEPSPKQDYSLPIDSAPEKKKNVKVFNVKEKRMNEVLQSFEEVTRLLHFTCLALRWINRTRKINKSYGPITAPELNAAEDHWIKLVQREHFGQEIARLKGNRILQNGSLLMKLTPFIDNDGFLRMNGRVGNAEFSEYRTSIILPANSRFVFLIMRYAHQKQTLHGGVQLTLRALRERFWIIHARNQVNKLIGRCMVCYRTKKLLLKQQMAMLPLFRTQQARPFTFVGCDYAGPFQIKTSDRRNAAFSKGYIALFICLTTKAIHLELVGSLSTDEYILALENFIARRGIPTTIFSDNATNFRCAEKEIHEFHEQLLSQTNALTRLLASKRITFKRIPAQASHMAGIWERAVGLVKYHLKRVMKNTQLTARRFDYVLKQVECCVNSRPLWAITPNSDDIEVITPSHFFNFQPINTLPRPNLDHIEINRLDHYQYLYRLYSEFWKCWSKEYLDQLQPRAKWPEKHPNVRVGQIVVVSDDRCPPSRWPLGKISAVYPARDGLVRVVDVKINGKTFKRPIHRLGVIPIQENEGLSCPSDDQINARENVE